MKQMLLIILLLSTPVLGENMTAGDISLTDILPKELFAFTEYTSLFTVRNEQHVSGETVEIDVDVAYWISQNGSILQNDSFSKTINSYSSSKTGMLQLNETGEYMLCGMITNSSILDQNLSNNKVCANFTAQNPFAVDCNISLDIIIENEKLFYEEGETLFFWNSITVDDPPPFTIKYEFFDLEGKILSSKETSNTKKKQYTPKIEEKVGAIILRNSFATLACNNSNNKTGEKLIVIKGEEDIVEIKSWLRIEDLHDSKNGYYFGDQMRVTASVYKGDTAKRAVKLWVEDEEGKKVSHVTSFTAKQKFTLYEVTLPVSLKDVASYKTSRYVVKIEGLNASTTDRIAIKKIEKENEVNKTAELLITSFYTRTKNPTDEIILYASISGNGRTFIELTSLNEKLEEEIHLKEKHLFKKSVKMQKGPNVFLLRVSNRESVTVEKSLLLEMDEEIKSVEQFSMKSEEQECPEIQQIEELLLPQEKIQEKNEPAVLAPITGMVVYEEENNVNILPLLGGLIGFLLLGILLQHAKQ